MTYDSTTRKVNIPKKRLFNGHEFRLFFTADKKNRVNGKAYRCRKHGFHTRVIELYPGVYCAYRRPKTVSGSSHDKHNINAPAGMIPKTFQGIQESPRVVVRDSVDTSK